MPRPYPQEDYLGDGLYARFDGWQIRLRAPRPDGDHVVYLDPAVAQRLLAFIHSLSEREPTQ